MQFNHAFVDVAVFAYTSLTFICHHTMSRHLLPGSTRQLTNKIAETIFFFCCFLGRSCASGAKFVFLRVLGFLKSVWISGCLEFHPSSTVQYTGTDTALYVITSSFSLYCTRTGNATPVYTAYPVFFQFEGCTHRTPAVTTLHILTVNEIIFVYLCDQHPVRVTCRIYVYAPDQLEVPFLRISLIDLFSVLFDLRVLIHSFSLLFNPHPPDCVTKGLASKRSVGNLLSRS